VAKNFNSCHNLNGCLTLATFIARRNRSALLWVKSSEGNHVHPFVSKVKNEGVKQLLFIPCYDLRRKDFT